MTLEIAGYDIKERIYAGQDSQVFSAIRAADGRSCVIKTRRADFESMHPGLDMQSEYEIIQGIDHPGVVEAYEVVHYVGGQALVMGDFGGQSLSSYLREEEGPLDIDLFLGMAIQIAAAVQAIHDAHTIHKDINPNNILVNRDSETVQIIDFGISSVLPKERQGIANPGTLEGTLLYMSPEQTGRMNRSIDYRTDLYSLGATFYQMITGRPPFSSDDAMELVHHHIAHEPTPPRNVRDDLPPVLSDIVLRLLAKAAEDRYQSASGLLADLERCRARWNEDGAVASFALGTQDVAYGFHIPEKLYGRDKEMAALLSTFERAASGPAELLLVSGYSGAGKSALIHEVQGSIVRSRGHFVSGKSDQLQRGAPFASLHRALTMLVEQILTEEDEGLRYWRNTLEAALGKNGRIIVETIPEVAYIVGEQPPVDELPPLESQNRFNVVFRRFVNAFCQPEHPLCIFLDDLQWVDVETLEWLERTVTDRSQGNLLIIGAYRDNEVDETHPLRVTIDRLHREQANLSELRVEPLSASTLTLLLEDTLDAASQDIGELAELVYAKTHGNPFFVNQLLHALHNRGAIAYDRERGGWRVDLGLVAEADISDNVVDLMIGRIKRLSDHAQRVLELAACIGNRFELETLAEVRDEPLETVRQEVYAAIRAGLVTQVRDARTSRYRFLHDRVQQAAYSMLSEDARVTTRLGIGRMMRDARAITATDERLFEIVDHLNAGRSLIEDEEERRELARLDLMASIRAKRAAAFAPALAYIEHAWALLDDDFWESPSAFTLELLAHRAEVEHLSGRPDAAEELYERALEHASDDMDKASVYEKQIHFFTDRAKFEDAYAAARKGASLLGLKLPARFVPPVLVYDLAATKLALRNHHIEDLVDLPRMEDERLVRAVALASAGLKAAYQCRPELAVHNAIKVVKLCLKHGNTRDAPIAYLVFGGIFLGGILGDIESGHSFGRLALSLIEKFENQQQRAEVNFVTGYFATSWTKPVALAEEHFRVAYHTGLETGDIFHASCGCTGIVQNMLMRGVHLNTVSEEVERFMSFLERVESVENIGTLVSARQAIYNLRGETRGPDSFSDGEFEESAFVQELSSYGSRHFAHFYHVNKMQCLYLWGLHAEAVDMAERSAEHLKDSRGMLHSAEHYFLSALIHAASFGDDEAHYSQRTALERVRDALKKMNKWASHCPENFEHKRLLIEAEMARIRGRDAHACELYDQAIEAAHASGFAHHEAMANEIAGRYYLAQDRRRVARFYLRNALNGYRSWGALGLVRALPERYPSVLDAGDIEYQPPLRARTDVTHTIIDTNKELASTLDLASVIKSSQVLSSEINLSRLLRKMMQLVIENAGAQRGVLFLQGRRGLEVLAEHSVDAARASVLENRPLADYPQAAHSIINYVLRAGQSLVLDDAVDHSTFRSDPYIAQHEPRSVLCTPLNHQGQLRGVLYLENNLTVGAFTSDRLQLLELLSGQMIISIDNALHYEQLEDKVAERTEEIAREKERSEALLLNILPRQTAEELKSKGRATTRHYDMVSVLFTDFVGFTSSVSMMPPQVLIRELDRCFRRFDELIERFNLEKIKTIGDAYMCAGGIPVANHTNPVEAVLAGLALQRYSAQFAESQRARGKPFWTCRTGIHTGPVIAGVVGKNKFAYDIWGDTVNTASRMESGGEVHRVNISSTTYELVREFFACTPRGKVKVKGKGAIDMYFVDRILPDLSDDAEGTVPNARFEERLDALRGSTIDATTLDELPSSVDELAP